MSNRRTVLLAAVILELSTRVMVAQSRRDSSRIALRGPTIIAFFAVTQAELDQDSTSGIVNALDDFQWYLPKVAPILRAHNVTLVERYQDTLLLIPLNMPRRTFVARDSVRVGYILWRPPNETQVHWGVMTDIDLICTARDYFGWTSDTLTVGCP